jgi:hypothetical protein
MLEGELTGDAGLLDSLSEEAGGDVLARSASQVAVVLPGAGKGLLILARQPVTEHRPRGGFMLILTTYGLSDEEAVAVESSWTSWWERHRTTAS